MMKLLLLSLLISSSAWAASSKLVFSLKKVVEYDDFTVKSVFTLLDNKKFSFKTSMGGFHLCSAEPAGDFNGRLSKQKYLEIIKNFKSMDKLCSKLKSCQTKRDRSASFKDYDWAILGWGDYSDKSYFLYSSTKRPKLLSSIMNLNKSLYQNAKLLLKIEKVKLTKSKAYFDVSYKGKGEFEFGTNPSNFIVMGKDGQRRLAPSKHSHVMKIRPGMSKKFSLDVKKHKLQKGDYIIYSPVYKFELTPCVVL